MNQQERYNYWLHRLGNEQAVTADELAELECQLETARSAEADADGRAMATTMDDSSLARVRKASIDAGHTVAELEAKLLQVKHIAGVED